MTIQNNAMTDGDQLRRSARTRRLARLVGLIAGVLLVLAAIVYVAAHGASVREALAALSAPSPAVVIGLLLAVLGNIVLTALLFSVLMSRYGKVGLFEMQALIGATTLLNYLPLRPGLFGRVAYHKLVNEIPIRATAQVVVISIALSVAVGLYAAAAVYLARSFNLSIIWLYLPLPMIACAGVLARRTRYMAAALFLRSIDVLVWAVRYVLVFRLLDQAIGFDTALALACISMVATMVPFISNGLGLREWAVGLAAPLLEISIVSPLALTADLVNRAAELVVVAVCGSLGMAMLSRRARRAGVAR